MRHNRDKARAAHERAVRRGKLGAAANAAKRMALPPPERPPRNDPGELLGVLQWHGADGRVHRYVVKQAVRKNQVAVTSLGRTWTTGFDALVRGLRKHLCPLTR